MSELVVLVSKLLEMCEMVLVLGLIAWYVQSKSCRKWMGMSLEHTGEALVDTGFLALVARVLTLQNTDGTFPWSLGIGLSDVETFCMRSCRITFYL